MWLATLSIHFLCFLRTPKTLAQAARYQGMVLGQVPSDGLGEPLEHWPHSVLFCFLSPSPGCTPEDPQCQWGEQNSRREGSQVPEGKALHWWVTPWTSENGELYLHHWAFRVHLLKLRKEITSEWRAVSQISFAFACLLHCSLYGHVTLNTIHWQTPVQGLGSRTHELHISPNLSVWWTDEALTKPLVTGVTLRSRTEPQIQGMGHLVSLAKQCLRWAYSTSRPGCLRHTGKEGKLQGCKSASTEFSLGSSPHMPHHQFLD
jgi:hypothetical protein